MGRKIKDFFKLNIVKGDIGLWMIYFLLCMVSIVTIYSASSQLTFKSERHWEPMVSQVGFLVAGFIIAVILSKVPCKYFKLIPVVGLPLAFCLLVYVLVASKGVNDASRWISLFGISFQPSEIAKTMLIMAVAVVLSKLQKEEKIKTKKGTKIVVRATKGGYKKAFTIVGLLTFLICGAIAPENFSTAFMLFTVIVIMMFIGNVPVKLMVKGLSVLLVVGALFVTALLVLPSSTLQNFRRAATWKHRIEQKIGLEDVDKDSQKYKDDTRQVNMSKVAIASSNITGVGVGNSVTRDFLPHAESDFIYSIIIEETGVAGAAVVLLLFVMLLIRVGRVAQKCDRFFPAFLVVGLGLMMVMQAMVNMSVAVGLIPVTGQTLPLISHGGTSIILTSFNFGLILSVSRYAEGVADKKGKAAKKIIEDEDTLLETDEIYSNVGMA